MANLIESMGYSLGKVHSGLMAYMADLSRNDSGPLTTFLNILNIPLPEVPIPYREWKAGSRIRLDMAIFDGDANIPSIIFEIKVDDHESISNGVAQTTRYADATENVNHRLFITLGHGEYFRSPFDDRFRWIRLDEFARAVKQTSFSHPNAMPIRDWSEALENEIARRDAVTQNNRIDLNSYRPGSWNIIFLGKLKESLPLSDKTIDVDPTCYTCGTRPDTILNFGRSKYPRYAEINNNGRLNVKITFDECQTDNDRSNLYQQTVRLLNYLEVKNSDIRPYNESSATMTVASLDIDLSTANGSLEYANEQTDTIEKLINYLKVLYARKGSRQTAWAWFVSE